MSDDNDTVGTEEKVLGPGAVLHKVEQTDEGLALAEPVAEESVPDLGVPAATPTPTPVTEPHQETPSDPAIA